MSMVDVIDSIEKNMWREMEKRSEPEEQPEMIDCSTLGDVPGTNVIKERKQK